MRPRPIIVLLHLMLVFGLVWLARDLTSEPIPEVQASPDTKAGKRLKPRQSIPVFRLA